MSERGSTAAHTPLERPLHLERQLRPSYHFGRDVNFPSRRVRAPSLTFARQKWSQRAKAEQNTTASQFENRDLGSLIRNSFVLFLVVLSCVLVVFYRSHDCASRTSQIERPREAAARNCQGTTNLISANNKETSKSIEHKRQTERAIGPPLRQTRAVACFVLWRAHPFTWTLGSACRPNEATDERSNQSNGAARFHSILRFISRPASELLRGRLASTRLHSPPLSAFDCFRLRVQFALEATSIDQLQRPNSTPLPMDQID